MYCASSSALDYKEVEKEIAERHDRLQGNTTLDEPPSTYD
jgi:hypothetical protein